MLEETVFTAGRSVRFKETGFETSFIDLKVSASSFCLSSQPRIINADSNIDELHKVFLA